GDPDEGLAGLHDADGVLEGLQVALQGTGVGRLLEPPAQLAGIGRRQPVVTAVAGQVHDGLGAQTTVEMVVQQHLGRAPDLVNRGAHPPMIRAAATWSLVPIGRFRTEGGQAHGDVLGALVARTVTDLLAGLGDDGLPGGHLDGLPLVLDQDGAAQHQRVLGELRRLRGLLPPGRGDHVRDGDRLVTAVDAADVLIDQLSTGYGNPRRPLDLPHHTRQSAMRPHPTRPDPGRLLPRGWRWAGPPCSPPAGTPPSAPPEPPRGRPFQLSPTWGGELSQLP